MLTRVPTLTGEKEMVQIGAQDERPSPGSEASEAAGACTEAAKDTVQLPKISRDQATAPGGEEAVADPPRRSLSPSGAWPADARPISLTDSVFTPWSERQQAPESGNHGSGNAPSQSEQAEKDVPGEVGVPASSSTGLVWTAAPASPLGVTELSAYGSPPWRATPTAATDQGDHGSQASPAGKIALASRRRMVQLVGVAAAVAGLVIAGGIYLYVQKASSARAAGDKQTKPQNLVAKDPEHVVSISPADGDTGVNGTADIRVEFSAPLSPTSPMPTLRPAIAGTWQRDGNTAVFVPDRGFRQRTKVTVRVPAGSTGVTSRRGGLLAVPVIARFRTGRYSNARLEQL